MATGPEQNCNLRHSRRTTSCSFSRDQSWSTPKLAQGDHWCTTKSTNLQTFGVRLNPILDVDGVLKAGGRLQNASISFDERHPIILAKTSPLATLLIRDAHARTSTTWKFIPSYAFHFGGLWEKGVKSVKGHLEMVIGNQSLTLEEMTTLLCEVKACLNSRPLTQLSNDPADLASVTLHLHCQHGDYLVKSGTIFGLDGTRSTYTLCRPDWSGSSSEPTSSKDNSSCSCYSSSALATNSRDACCSRRQWASKGVDPLTMSSNWHFL